MRGPAKKMARRNEAIRASTRECLNGRLATRYLRSDLRIADNRRLLEFSLARLKRERTYRT